MPAFLRIEIFPSDMQRSIDFYTQVLRFNLLRHEDDYAYFQRDGIFIGALVGPDAHHPQGAISAKREYRLAPTGVEIVMEVDDLEKERELVVHTGWALDADVKLQSWGLRDFRVIDPDGYYLRITEHSTEGHGKGEV